MRPLVSALPFNLLPSRIVRVSSQLLLIALLGIFPLRAFAQEERAAEKTAREKARQEAAAKQQASPELAKQEEAKKPEDEKADEEKKPADPMSSGTFNGLKFRSIGPAFTSGRVVGFAVDPNNASRGRRRLSLPRKTVLGRGPHSCDHVKVPRRFQYEFEWDPLKARQNLRKHGVAFERAATIFLDPDALSEFDVVGSRREERWITLGLDRTGALLVVSHTYRAERENSARIRLISARKPTRKETKQYGRK